MTNEYRKAVRVVLHDHYTAINLPDFGGGIFGDFELEMWRIEGRTLERLLIAAGIHLQRPKNVTDLSVDLIRIPAHTGKNTFEDAELKEMPEIQQIEARVIGASLLDLRLKYSHDYTAEITYCGGFTVEWASE